MVHGLFLFQITVFVRRGIVLFFLFLFLLLLLLLLVPVLVQRRQVGHQRLGLFVRVFSITSAPFFPVVLGTSFANASPPTPATLPTLPTSPNGRASVQGKQVVLHRHTWCTHRTTGLPSSSFLLHPRFVLLLHTHFFIPDPFVAPGLPHAHSQTWVRFQHQRQQ